jgi:hypothetical protein
MLVVGNRDGQHRPQAPVDRGRAELGPTVLGGQVLGIDQGLAIEGIDAWALAVLDLQLLQVIDTLVGHGHVTQQLVGVDRHQPGSIDGKQLVGGIHDPAQGLIQIPGGIAQLVELPQGLGGPPWRTSASQTPPV